MEISKKEYIKHFKGFIVLDCVVRAQDMFYFTLCEDYTQWPSWDGGEEPSESELKKRVVVYISSDPEGSRWSSAELTGVDILRAGVSYLPDEKFVGVTADGGAVYVVGGGVSELEAPLPDWIDGGFLRGGVTRCRTIDGHVYMAGGGRSVAMRRGRNDWLALNKQIPFTYEKDWERAGFRDIDGFGESDIYCIGGMGDVWNFNGSVWTQIHFPSNIHLFSVCCAGDGQVYVSGIGGTTFKGRGQKWKQIFKGEMTIPFKRMVWFENKVWCTSDYGLWTIENDKLVEPAEVTDEIKVCSGYMSTKDDVLLVAGPSGAAFKEAGVWHKIF